MAEMSLPVRNRPVTFAEALAAHDAAVAALHALPDAVEKPVHEEVENAYLEAYHVVSRTSAPTLTDLLAKAGIIWEGGPGTPDSDVVGLFMRDFHRLAGPKNDDVHDDSLILGAWDRRKVAYTALNAMSEAERSDNGIDSPEEKRLWREIKAAESVIAEGVATTSSGIEAKLWVGLEPTINAIEAHENDALTFGDLEALEAISDRLDVETRIILSAIRALRTLGET